MYTCPDCKTALENLYCRECRHQYERVDGVPVLLSNEARFQSVATSVGAYDSIYRSQTNVWENQGRTPEFLQYFSGLLGQFPATRFLEVGCGEGFLHSKVQAGEKFAVDLSVQALRAAQAKTQGQFSVALAERLPFPAEYFDLVASVGVMEHFLDDREAAREIRRVLRPGGYYVCLVHVEVTSWERLGMKMSQFVFPIPRPLAFTRWFKEKVGGMGRREPEPAYVKQPIQNKYSTRTARAVLEQSTFNVLHVIHKRKQPDLPLEGHHVVIYVAQKPKAA